MTNMDVHFIGLFFMGRVLAYVCSCCRVALVLGFLWYRYPLGHEVFLFIGFLVVWRPAGYRLGMFYSVPP